MSSFKQRSEYFKSIATKNKLIAHDAAVDSENRRLSFFRINDEDELKAACKSWIHFPCVVHAGHNLYFNQPGTGLPQMMVGNHLYFLSKTNRDTYTYEADAIEAAYDEALKAMMQFISYMLNDKQENGVCGEMFLFDLNRAKADQLGPLNQVLYGWYLQFMDREKANELDYDAELWGNGNASLIVDADTTGSNVAIPAGWQMIQFDYTNVTAAMWVYIDYIGDDVLILVDFGNGPKLYQKGKWAKKNYTSGSSPTIKIYHNDFHDLFIGNANAGAPSADDLQITGDMPTNLQQIMLSDRCTSLPELPATCVKVEFSGTSLSAAQLNSLLDNLIANGTHGGEINIVTNPRQDADAGKLSTLQGMGWNIQAWGL